MGRLSLSVVWWILAAVLFVVGMASLVVNLGPALTDQLASAGSFIAAVIFGVAALRTRRPVVHKVRLDQLLLHTVGGQPPRVGDVKPELLGVKASIDSDSLGLTEYVTREVEDDIQAKLLEGGMVVLCGAAAAGKSRTGIALVQELFPDRRLYVPNKAEPGIPSESGSPANAVPLRALLDSGHQIRDAVVWLDDVEGYFGEGGVNAGLVSQLCPNGVDDVVIVATLRQNKREEIEAGANSQDRLSIRRLGADLLQDLNNQHRIIFVPGEFSAKECETAEEVQGALMGAGNSRDSRLAQALHAGAWVGEFLVSGPQMMARWTSKTSALELVGAAVIDAAVDARRSGFDGPIPVAVLEGLTREFLPTRVDRADVPPVAEAMIWASQPVEDSTTSSCLIPHDGYTSFTAADYLVDRADAPRSPLAGKPIHNGIWPAVLGLADPDQAITVGHAAYTTGNRDIAHTAWCQAANVGNTSAMVNLGNLLHDLGDLVEAEEWFRKATSAGSTMGMFYLGNLLHDLGDLVEAEEWFRKAADAELTEAMFGLASLLVEREDLLRAEEWFRKAASAGNTNAINSLGDLLKGRGDLAEAEEWFREAADAGNTMGMFNLGLLLKERGDLVEAEERLRDAVGAGNTKAMNSLGNLLMQRGDLVEAEERLRDAVGAGNTKAMNNLGNLLMQRGDLVEAEERLRDAIGAGNTKAMNSLGNLLMQRGDPIEAEEWLREAASAGNTMGMFNLGNLLKGRGDLVEAEEWFCEAADAGNTYAMNNLGSLLKGRGDVAEAEEWFREAASAGNIKAMNNLGSLLKGRGDVAEADKWYRKAIDAGNSNAMFNLGVLLKDRGRWVTAAIWWFKAANAGSTEMTNSFAMQLKKQGKLAKAEVWFREGAEAGNSNAMINLGSLLKERGDLVEAREWYREAVKVGNAGAITLLSRLLEEQVGSEGTESKPPQDGPDPTASSH